MSSDNEELLLRQRKALVEFGERALVSQDLDEVLDEACRLVSEALDTHLAKFMQIEEDGTTLLIRNGVGWAPGVVGKVRGRAEEGTSEWYTLKENAPVISVDSASEDRFTYHPFLIENGVRAFVNVLVHAPGDESPFGIFEVDSRAPRSFTDSDVDFLRGYANLIAGAIERFRIFSAMRDTEAQLRIRERHHQISVELNPQIPWTADTSGAVTSFDERWLKLTGLSRKESLGHGWLEASHPDDKEKLAADWAQSVATMQPLDAQVRLRKITGEYGWFRTRAFPSVTADCPCDQWYGTVEDIGERMQLEAALRDWNEHLAQYAKDRTQQLKDEQRERALAEEKLRQSQKMEAVGQLTGGIAHDFNNMLGSISASLELLQLRIDQERYQDLSRYSNLAMSSVRRAAALTHRLLAFSRQQSLAPKLLQPSQVVTELEELISRSVGPNILVDCKLNTDDTIYCDPNQLESALLNLAINSRDAMETGGKLTIETRRYSVEDGLAAQRDLEAGEYVGISVTDNGTGMPPDVLARAFDPFFTTKQIGEGTGLGLSMIHGFTRQSGGQARIHSTLGIGTTVTMYFPRQKRDAVSKNKGTETVKPLPQGNGETILVVDDEIPVRQLMAELLGELGYIVTEAVDSTSALKQAEGMPNIDLLITDIGLPGKMNGKELAGLLQRNRPNLKILFITGFANDPAAGQSTMEGEIPLLTKPFSLSDLGSRVRSVLGDTPNQIGLGTS